MRVLHVTSGRLFGGIEQMLVTLAKHRALMKTPEIDTSFAIAAPGRLEDELRATGASVTLVGDVRLSRPSSIFQGRSAFARLVDARRPDVVVCHAPWSVALFGPAARRRGVPIVWWQHDAASGRTLVERVAKRTPADLVICNSRWTAKSAAALNPGAPVAVIHPPVVVPDVDPALRAALRASLETAPSDVVVLSASRLERWKGHVNLLRGIGRIADAPAWTLWIAGGAQRPHEREYAAMLRQEAERLGIARRVRFLGERRDVPALMKAADVLCQMNEGPEPFGIVFAEALLSGIPVVTADLGGAPEIVSDACGRLVRAGDLEALGETLRSLVGNPQLRCRLGAAGPDHARSRCAPSVVLPQIARALASASASAAA
ncbi:MAG TPA: glycosyltransferase [Vicinamibacterales bacterium]|jgi:glycosyltransferase involved in cell wall biosynthesis